MEDTALSLGEQYCTFYLDDLFFGVDVTCVQEVIRYQEMTMVPLAPPAVRGLINLRGQIVTAIDLRSRLSLPARESERPPMNVVVRSAECATSLLVDVIGDVIEVDGASFEEPPNTLNENTRRLIKGVHKLDGQLLMILDPERAIESA